MPVDVEIELKEDVNWFEVLVDPPAGPIIEIQGQNTMVRGVVDDVDKDGVLSLRLGSGVLVVETLGEPPLDIVGRKVRLPPGSVILYPSRI